MITPNLKVATHLQAKEIQINGIMQSCVFPSSNEVLSQIKMETLLKLYYSCVIPALLYGCETWILNSSEIKRLNRIQINTLRKILKLSTSTPIPIIYSEIGEIPIQFRFHERQLLYLWKLVNKKDQAHDVYRIQSHECETNTGSIASYYKQLLVTYDITTNENGLSKTSKEKWKKIVKSKISHQANQWWYKTESSKLSKLQEINKRKKITKREKYVTQFKRPDVSLLIKARSRMLSSKNNFKG